MNQDAVTFLWINEIVDDDKIVASIVQFNAGMGTNKPNASSHQNWHFCFEILEVWNENIAFFSYWLYTRVDKMSLFFVLY